MKALSHFEPDRRSFQTEEPELIERVRNGEEGAFEELALRYQPKILKQLRSLFCDATEAEDILQDVMITLYKKIGTFEGKSSFSTWVYRVTLNAFLMHKRKQRSQRLYSLGDMPFEAYTETMNQDDDAEMCPYSHVLSNEYHFKLERALAELPKGYRDVFLMRSREDLSIEEVSERMGLSSAAVKSRSHRARQFLKDRLSTNYFN